ncbi:hypothetical protein Poli38472_010232 [Pythium oligandrum]|uniref:J domain-containing protein n=1 Tax=Pythium oligandrum TaxID=41045 RepID=A0A8K1C9J9_PYTOL|nr:hypothetical protein Poli38472_010232 [Pythium oligandrum]|eukprot:TMW58673.1 hypothetical protein Poli38472_010232 [Pythium oligandrum]
MSSAKMPRKYSEKEMEMHREYMKKYQKTSSDLHKEKVKYKDHYELLEIARHASHTEIRQAYRKLALKYHPDRNSSAEAEERWEGVPAAYAIISDPNSRAEYDATLPTRDALVEFYKTYNPAKLDNATIQTIIDGWYGREVELFQMLNSKYEIAPHQGINRRASESLPSERSRSISVDNMSSEMKHGEVAMTWMESVGSAICCKGVMDRLFAKTYYEVHTQSPGISMVRQSDTPGQPNMHANLQSPAPPPEYFKKSKGAASVDDENVSTATTEEDLESSASIVDESSSTSSSKSSVGTPAVK